METIENKKNGTDPLSYMLAQVPLEKPSNDFTMNVMAKICPDFVPERIPFYKKPVFIGIFTILLASLFLLFYNADFSWNILVEQIGGFIETLREIFPSIRLSNRKMDISPTLVAPILIIGIIFLVDRIIIIQRKNKEHRTYLI